MPITAGISMLWASIAVWEIGEPNAVTNAAIFRCSRSAASVGVMSSAHTTAFSGMSPRSRGIPERIEMSRWHTSRISAERARMYSLSMDSSIFAKTSEVCSTAYSAFTCPSVIIPVMESQ